MIHVIAGTSDRRHKSLPLPLSQEDDAWCRPRFSAVISLCQAGGERQLPGASQLVSLPEHSSRLLVDLP
jgi:hypothetical protein